MRRPLALVLLPSRDMSTNARLLGGVAVAAGLVAGLRAWQRARRRIDIAGRTVLVIGGSRGLGLALAREFGRRGARVAIGARDADTLERAAADLAGRGITARAIACDVADGESVERAIAQTADAFGGPDILVNVAGVIEVGPLETMTPSDWHEAMAINFWGPLHAMLAVAPRMRARGGGRIVNIVSIGGKVPVPHLVPYSASKFALGGVSEGVATEFAADGIDVTTVYPGLMRTGSPRHALFKGKHRAEYAWFTIADSLPGLSVDADRAARQIVDACRDGDPHVIVGMPARLATLAHAIVPGLTIDLLRLAHRLLPAAGGIGQVRARGRESQSALAPSPLTMLTERAARRYNQTG
jgi:NAD(P)-dependent dehydrogenase (short-subunit alcohol dehydrogenase family)